MIRWYRTEMILLWRYSLGWALKFSVPGRRWLAIILLLQGAAMATAWLLVSPIVRHPRPPTFKPWFIGRCHAYMNGASWKLLTDGSVYKADMWQEK